MAQAAALSLAQAVAAQYRYNLQVHSCYTYMQPPVTHLPSATYPSGPYNYSGSILDSQLFCMARAYQITLGGNAGVPQSAHAGMGVFNVHPDND